MISAREHEAKEVTYTLKTASEAAVKIWPTNGDFYFDLQLGPTGFYTTGKVKFGDTFLTLASIPAYSEYLAASFAHQLFSVWKEHSEKSSSEEKAAERSQFNVLECGAGNGDLCVNILAVISRMSASFPQWADFFSVIQYHIVEISPALVDRQREKTERFNEKVHIHQGDATNLAAIFPEEKMSAVFSVELVDMFRVEEVEVNGGSKVLGLAVPMIDLIAGEPYIKEAGLDLKELIRKTIEYQNMLDVFNQNKAIYFKTPPDEEQSFTPIYLSGEDFFKLHKVYVRENDPNQKVFAIGHAQVDISFCPPLADFFKRHPHYGKSEGLIYPCLGILPFMQSVKSVLTAGGHVITVDYGETFTEMGWGYTTFGSTAAKAAHGNTKPGNNPDADPGFIDITTHVDYSLVADSGREVGLSVLHYGELPQMLPPNADINKMLTPSDRNSYVDRARNFKVLVQTNAIAADSPTRFFGGSKKVYSAEVIEEKKQKNMRK